MPKDTKHIAAAQNQRKKVKEKLSKYVPGKVVLQVLGTGAVGAPKALYMFSDQSRYLFNCSEGTQRLAHEHKMKLAKLEHIFVTQPVWRNIGGLPGIALTIQDVGVPEITLHGPPGLDNIFAATKRFVVLKDLKVHMAPCGENLVFEDNVMKVYYVPLTMPNDDIEEDILTDSSVDEPIQEEVSQSSPEPQKVQDSQEEAVVMQMDASTSTPKRRKRKRKSLSVDSSTKRDFENDLYDNTDYYAYEHSGHVSPDPSASQGFAETTTKGMAMAYVCSLKSRPGALNLMKCVEMGVRPGPLLGKLKGGEDVTLLSGKIVSSKDVCEPEDPGLIFIVVDCPSLEYLDSLVASDIMKRHQKNAKSEQDIAQLVVHFTPQDIVVNARYQDWMNEFPSITTHLMLNEFNTCMGSEAVHRIQYKLNLLAPEIFPLLGDKGTKIIDRCSKEVHKKPKLEDSSTSNPEDKPVTRIDLKNLQRTPTSPTPSIRKLLETECASSDPKIAPEKSELIFPRTFCTFHLRPKRGLDRSTELTLNPKEYIDESLNLRELGSELRKLKIKMMKKVSPSEEYPKLLFLGTGSCIPNKTRNTSGILLSLSNQQHILMDCGEGTYGQIVRFFGPEEAHYILAHIDAIYISHLHADHHIGLIGVLQGRRKALDHLHMPKKPPLYLFAPKQIMTWLNFYDRCFERILNEFELVPNSSIMQHAVMLTDVTRTQILHNLNISEINTCAVKHCPNAFGVTLVCRNGYRLTYSGDTMPSDHLVTLGMGSHVLIHEATMEDELVREAEIKMHSTTNQAIQVGKRMKAKNVILTHFSQRYAKLPRLNDNFGSNVGIAFDNMQVRISDLSLTPELYPALKVLFAEHFEELENKALKRQMKELLKRKSIA